jgi:hypothetical protein
MTDIVRMALVACSVAAFSASAVPAFADAVVSGSYPYVNPYGPPYGNNAHAAKHRFGFDPDPNIRFEILRTRNWRKG